MEVKGNNRIENMISDCPPKAGILAHLICTKTKHLVNTGIMEQTDVKKLFVRDFSVNNELKSSEGMVKSGFKLLLLQSGLALDQEIRLSS